MGDPRRRGREHQRPDRPPRQQRLPRDEPHSACPPRQAGQPGRHLAGLGPQRLGPVPAPGRHQPRRVAGRRPAQPTHGTPGAATPRPLGTRTPDRLAGSAGRATAASAPVALASPAVVSRYRCRRGRPGTGSSCQHASTRPRSASRIKIGYSVPDFSPACLASAYPCRHCEGSSHNAASTDSVWAENSARDLTPVTLHR